MRILYKNRYWELNKEYDIDKILYLLIDRPNSIISWNDFIWENKKGYSHRDYDLPAYIEYNSHISWNKNGKLHRKNNYPVMIWNDGITIY